ncbi:hypothetical protein [Inediibacterium massiliense]|uniref:hypothetical protein n=1 Tax=Inediibacterium massiliense TaxID=1658111 RepID=UPI0018FE1870|nr:hypothetical protein [Inediibacterium massiliense]
MTQKTRKGIVGKKTPTTENRQDVGIGISFTDQHISNSKEIEAVIEKKKQDLK